MSKIANVTVERGSPHAEYALMWESGGARFHVWLTDDKTFHAKGAVLFKNALLGTKRDDPGYFQTRRLQVVVGKNKAMIDAALAEAVAGHLFEKADEKLAAAEKERLAQNEAAYKVKLAEQAGPEMLKVLRGIAEFWSGEQKDSPLSPGAMLIPAGNFYSSADGGEKILAKTGGILNPDDYQTIADAVRRVVFFAETGGAVELPQTEVE